MYSLRSSLLLGFFAGPLPLVLYWSLNSYRLKRPLDAIAYLLAIAGFAALVYAYYSGATPEFAQWTQRHLGGAGTMRTVLQAYAVALWAGFYLMHRKQYRSMGLFGVASPSPWIALLACVILGVALTYGLIALLVPEAI
ncbi:MAG: hypothetical protein V4631_15635 [Pseudomonadota bacterium]